MTAEEFDFSLLSLYVVDFNWLLLLKGVTNSFNIFRMLDAGGVGDTATLVWHL